MITTWNVTSFTSCPYRASRCCRVRAAVAQNWRSLRLEIQVTGAHNRTPENAERREKLKKKESEPTYTWHLKRIQFWRRGASSSKNHNNKKLNRNGFPGRRHGEDGPRGHRHTVDHFCAILRPYLSLDCFSEGIWTGGVFIHRVESQSSLTTGLLFLTILNLVNNRLLNRDIARNGCPDVQPCA